MGAQVRVAARKPRWAAGVVIPARDEEQSIVACLDAVIRALDQCQHHLSASWIVVVADCCQDETAALAAATLRDRGTVLECSASSPGRTRRLGVTEVLAHFDRTRRSRVWIANTDADSSVASNWMQRQLELARHGYCGVAGIVQVDTVAGLDEVTLQALLADYKICEDGTHPHVHGANLGVRADAYIDAGCWSSLAVAEDHCLWSRIKARGWPTTSCAKTVVRTSGRLYGRAVGGYADTLRKRVTLMQAEAVPCTR